MSNCFLTVRRYSQCILVSLQDFAKFLVINHGELCICYRVPKIVKSLAETFLTAKMSFVNRYF